MPETPPLPQLAVELRDLVLEYAKQETVAPLQSLGRYVAFGLAGALLLAVGTGAIAVGLLRLLQTETGSTFQGNWSFAPYVIVFAILVLFAIVMWLVRDLGRGARR